MFRRQGQTVIYTAGRGEIGFVSVIPLLREKTEN
jgi:hypothetical protein